jgi:hypothetical protein
MYVPYIDEQKLMKYLCIEDFNQNKKRTTKTEEVSAEMHKIGDKVLEDWVVPDVGKELVDVIEDNYYTCPVLMHCLAYVCSSYIILISTQTTSTSVSNA